MITLKKIVLCTIVALLPLNTFASAYIGVKMGPMIVNETIASENPYNTGFVLGVSSENKQLALEAEFTNSVNSGTLQGFSDINIDIQTVSLYGVFRTHGSIYLKGRIGVISEAVTMSSSVISVEADESGTSLGAGLGFKVGSNNNIEIEYTIIEADVNFLRTIL